MITVCVCGGGNLAHAFAGTLSSNPYVSKLTVLTRHPEKWRQILSVWTNDTDATIGGVFDASNDYAVLKHADVVILTLPAHVRYEYLLTIRQYIASNTLLLAVPGIGGINFIFDEFFPNNPYVCCQRVPYICRIIEYGKSVKRDLKKSIDIYYSGNVLSEHKEIIQHLLNIGLCEISSFWPLLLSNSNPIIHIARLYEILTSSYPCEQIPLFYEEWGDCSSQLAITMDAELEEVMNKLQVLEFENLLQHYEVSDYQTLTQKIRKIPAFHGIMAPMCQQGRVFVLDSQSRYLTEDLILGTCFIKFIASSLKIATPTIDKAIYGLQNVFAQILITEEGIFNLDEWQKSIGKDFYNLVCHKYIIQQLSKLL